MLRGRKKVVKITRRDLMRPEQRECPAAGGRRNATPAGGEEERSSVDGSAIY